MRVSVDEKRCRDLAPNEGFELSQLLKLGLLCDSV